MKKPEPLVTVVVTTYNRKLLLKETLLSILSQSYSKIEVIVVNDDVLDSLENFITSFNDQRLKLVEIPHSGRPAVPRNIGISYASGDLIAFCDDDDIFLPGKIKSQVQVFAENPDVKLCYTGIALIDEDSNPVARENGILHKKDFESQLTKNDITFSTIMICKDTLKEHRVFNERPILRASEDYLFIMDIIYKYPIFFIEEPLLHYRVHKKGISYCNSTKKFLKYYIRMIICMFTFFAEKKITFAKFIYLIVFHLGHTLKQILFPYYSSLKKLRRNHV